jgi:MOSC domain-containing protein YiiM
MTAALHLSMNELEAGLETIRQSPTDDGRLALIVRRPAVDAREVLPAGQFESLEGLAGDSWITRGTAPNREAQLTLMNSKVIALLAGTAERWALAGDQLFVDLDLSVDNLPAGTRLAIGEAVIEVSALPHTGCDKFKERFGLEALKFVNSPEGKQMRLRGLNAKVIQAGAIRSGDRVRKL